MEAPLLSAVIAAPLAGAIIAFTLRGRAAFVWALVIAAADLALAGLIMSQVRTDNPTFQLVERHLWLPQLGIQYALGVDGISVFLIILNALIALLSIAASARFAAGPRSGVYFGLMLLLTGAMQGVFLSTNLFPFYVFWELMLVPGYLLVGMFGGRHRVYAAIKFVLYTAIGSLLMLVAIVVVGNIASSGDGAITLDLQGLIQSTVPGQAHFWLFLAFGAAFAVKSGLFPLHSWAPDAYAEAPIPVAMMLAGVMAKTGTYGFIRFCLPLFPSAVRQLAPLLATLSVIGILFFALQALIATDFRRMLAYVSLSHMGVIVLGIFALNTQGIEGAILQMVNHGILIAALFFIAGILEDRTGSRSLRDYGALATKVPWLATAFMIVSLATLGLPGMNSFAGEFLAFLGAFRFNPWTGLLATFVVVPAAWYMLRFVQGATQGPVPMSGPVAAALEAKGAGGGIRDLAWHESLILLPVIVLIFGLGLAPGTVTGRIEPSVTLVSSPYAPVTASRVQSGHLGTHVGSHA